MKTNIPRKPATASPRHTVSALYRDPKAYEFNELDFENYKQRFWRCPTNLVADELFGSWLEGFWKRTPSATSILPVLAIETWPGKKVDALCVDAERLGRQAAEIEPPSGTKADQWTPWAYISRRQIAAVAGINKDSVRAALAPLVSYGFVQLQKAQARARGGGFKTYFRLRSDLFPEKGAPHVQFSGSLLYGGMWAMLPTNAARHLYLVLSLLDAVRCEHGLAEQVEPQPDEETLELILQKKREAHPLSIADLTRYSGLRRSTLVEAKKVLLSPMFKRDGVRLSPVLSGKAREAGGAHWYAPNRAIVREGWHWSPDVLNDADAMEQKRLTLWPQLASRRNS